MKPCRGSSPSPSTSLSKDRRIETRQILSRCNESAVLSFRLFFECEEISSMNIANSAPEIIYCCRKCRKELFLCEDVIHDNTMRLAKSIHQQAASESGKKGFHAKRTEQNQLIQDAQCTSVFISLPKPWMNIQGDMGDKDAIELFENSGKIQCPKCHCKLGSFSWSGQQCSCSQWITPAFQFTLSHIDPKPVS
jgi:hypothetical protein